MSVETKIRMMAHNKSRVFISDRRRAKTFAVTGPDGKLYRTKSKRAAMANLLARLRVWTVQPWAIQADV
jgi:hypothetical protein